MMEQVTVLKVLIQECYRLSLMNIARLAMEQRTRGVGIDKMLDKELNDTSVVAKELGTVMREQ